MLTSQYSILNLYLKCRTHSDFQGSLLCSHLVGPASIILFDYFIDAFEKDYFESENFFITIEFKKF